ncbi:hypothetical protein HMPREF2565_01330 [Corynebacterium sp. HMSC072A04]|nr:hypothetical protein HMPREF2565_01330 [Corynebacterium sp. HMSC072A04]
MPAVDRPAKMTGALDYDGWERLEHDLFDGAGDAVQKVREHARANGAPPVAFLLAVVQYVLACMPGNVGFDAGMGRGSMNLFIVLLGKPGAGKDRLMRLVRNSVHVFDADTPLKPVSIHLGSGEGVTEALQPPEGLSTARPVLFEASEVGTLHTRLTRQGSTLRGTLLDIYSGNSLGVTNKGQVVVIEEGSYTAGLWVAAQPDKAHLLLDGEDDGFRHRFVWTELLDPGKLPERPENTTRLKSVLAPQQVISGTPVSFPEKVKQYVWQQSHLLAAYGVSGSNTGHRTQTRCKVAAGLALLRSSASVSMDDWRRAGVLMDYSDKVQAFAASYSKDKEIQQEVDRLERKELAQEEKRARDERKFEKFQLRALDLVDAVDDGAPPANWTQFLQTLASRDRPLMKRAAAVLDEMEAVRFSQTDTGAQLVERGPSFHLVLEGMRHRVS